MSAAVDERKLERRRWLDTAAQWRHGVCSDCGRDRDDDDKPLLVARPERGRSFKCFDCSTQPKRRRTVTTKTAPVPVSAPPSAGTLLMLPLAKLKPAADNPRKNVGDVTELADSMRELGVLEPFIAVPQNGHYLIVAGARRYAGALLAKLETVPVIVRELTDEQRVKAMLIENLQREDLTPLEEASVYRRLVEEFGIGQRELATQVGRSQGHISKRIQLLELPAAVHKELDSGGITLEDARALLALKDMPARLEKALKHRNQYGGIPGQVKSELQGVETETKIKAAIAQLEADGLKIVKVGQYGDPARGVKLDSYGFRDVTNMSAAGHATEPCHAAMVDDYGRVHLVCTDKNRHKGITKKDAPAAVKEAEAKERAKQKSDQLHAREKNIQLGAALTAKLAAPAIDARNMRLLADLLMVQTGTELAQTSFRYTDEASQTVITKKDGTVSRIVHVEGTAARQLVDERLEAAETPEQIMGVLLQALIAARYRDTLAVPASSRYGHVRGVHHAYGYDKSEKRAREAVEKIAGSSGVIARRPKAAA